MNEYGARMTFSDFTAEERMKQAEGRIAKLEHQLAAEREFFLDMMFTAGDCAKCRFFAVCGPQYDCRATLARKARAYVKKTM